MLATGKDIEHYSNLYSCKYFRNRVLRLQALCVSLNLDAIVLVNGVDSQYDGEMKKLCNWLLFGLSTNDICGAVHDGCYSDSFFVVSRDGLQAYTNSAGFKHFSKICTLVQNLNMYTLTKSDEEDTERQEVIKIAQFYEMLFDKKAVGMPVRKLDAIQDEEKLPMQLVEKWPLVQAYGLDMVGNGFFTMKHGFVNVREELNRIYREYDSFSKYRIVNEEIERLNVTYFDNFFNLNRDTPQKRQQRTEHELIEAFWLRYRFSLLQRKKNKDLDEVDVNDGLPLPRALIGSNTNKDFSEISDTDKRLYKFNEEGIKDDAMHFTMEYVEKNINLRFARTFFLCNQSQNFMRNMYFSQEEEYRVASAEGKKHELNAKTLLSCYRALILAFEECSDLYLKGEIKLSELTGNHGFQTLKKFLQPKVNNFDTLLKDGKDSFLMHIQLVDSYGQQNEFNEKVNGQQLVMIRMQIKNIMSEIDNGLDLGSVIYGNSFLLIDDQSVYINVTQGVPNYQAWYTNNNHHEHVPLDINTMKNLHNEHLGDRLDQKKGGVLYQDQLGVLPIKEEYSDVFDDVVLNGKLVFYEKGFIFTDNKLQCLALPFSHVEKMNFYITKQWWVEIITVDPPEGSNLYTSDLFPQNQITHQKIYFKVDKKFFEEKFPVLEKILMTDETQFLSRAVKIYDEECPYVHDSLALKNFFINQKYNKQFSTEFFNIELNLDLYKEYMEYTALYEFAKVRSKDFIPFQAFSSVYRIADQSANMPNNKNKDLVKKLLQGTEQKASLIIVSGIPGSGKGRLANYIANQIGGEKDVYAVSFKMPTVQESIAYDTNSYVKALINYKSTDEKAQRAKVFVATLPGYNHLKKAIFELKKSEALSQHFDIKYVITKVAAGNFYMNRNRNYFQYLVENSMKGVSNAVIFEKQNRPQSEVNIMTRTLMNANFGRNVILTAGKTFNIDDLAKVLCYQNEKFSILYNKYFYGFEKEGKSNYFLANSCQGAYFNFRYPLNEEMVPDIIMKAINVPLNSELINKEIRNKTQSEIDKEEQDKIDEQNKINEMEPLEKKRYLREKKRQQQLIDDALQENILREEMEVTKRRVGTINTKDPLIERIRGYINVEGQEENQDYQLTLRFGELQLKGLKNGGNRLQPQQLGFLVYGRNLSMPDGSVNPVVKDAFKCARTNMTEKKSTRARESITDEEIEMLEAKYLGQDMPEDGINWIYTGYCYMSASSIDKKSCYEHPNREFLIKRYLEEINNEIGDYNRDVQKEWKMDAQKFD